MIDSKDPKENENIITQRPDKHEIICKELEFTKLLSYCELSKLNYCCCYAPTYIIERQLLLIKVFSYILLFSIFISIFTSFNLLPEYRDQKKRLKNFGLTKDDIRKYWCDIGDTQLVVYITTFCFILGLIIFITINQETMNKILKIIFYFVFYIVTKFFFS